MKIQYPGVADSIESDIENVRRLLDYTNLIPKGLYLDRAMKVKLIVHERNISCVSLRKVQLEHLVSSIVFVLIGSNILEYFARNRFPLQF